MASPPESQLRTSPASIPMSAARPPKGGRPVKKRPSGATSKKKSTSKKRPAAAAKPSTSKKRSAGSKTKAASKASAKRRPNIQKRPSSKKGAGRGSRSHARLMTSAARAKRPIRWRRVLLIESGMVLGGVALGIIAAGYALWLRASHDVDAFLADPPASRPGVVYSGPIRLEVGQRLHLHDVAGDLLSGGYERVDTVDGPDQFSIHDGRLDVWTGAWNGPGRVPEGRASVRVVDDRIAATSPQSAAILKPTVLAVVGDLESSRTKVTLKKVSRWVGPTVLAMEDARFRDHRGLDPIGLLRAILHNLSSDGRMHGGSTLTQQLAKNLFLTQDRTAQRKIREGFFAAALEAKLDKDTLLEMYLSEVYLGQAGGVPLHGVEPAARAWFAVSASRLTLAQAATIAGIISAPNRYSPSRHPERAIERRNLVLDRLLELGWADAADVAAARREALTLTGQAPGRIRRAPWAVDVAMDKAEEALGPGALGKSGYQLHTTIQPHLQREAESAVRRGLSELQIAHPATRGAQAALVAVRADDGSVIAMVGGRDYLESPFNRADQAWRQAGSTIKPLTMLAAFDRDPTLHPASRVVDEPISRSIDGRAWTPGNYDGRYLGDITLRRSIELSRNIPAIKLAEEVGPRALQAFYRDVGLTRATNLPSAALGAFNVTPTELAGAYTIFPGGGEPSVPRVVEAITDADGNLIIAYPPQSEPVASARGAAMSTAVLQGVIQQGTGRAAIRLGVTGPVGGKTGTTDQTRDAWFVGFTPSTSVAVWVGHDRGANLGVTGSKAALPIWSRFVVSSGIQGGRFVIPDGMQRRALCADSGLVARGACPRSYDEVLSDGQGPNRRCDQHGGPVVEARSWLGGLFGKKKADIEGQGASGEDAGGATP